MRARRPQPAYRVRCRFIADDRCSILAPMGKTKTNKADSSRQILTDSHGNATHVVLTIEEFQEMEELIEDLQEFREYYEAREDEKTSPWETAKNCLGI